MDSTKKRTLFLLVIGVLVVLLVVVSVITLLRGPRDNLVELVSATETEYIVDDLYEGQMHIPKFNVSDNHYKPDSFLDRKGVITYEDGPSYIGINVNEQQGEIDWAQVAASDVDYVLIRVGYREYGRGKLVADKNFEANIKGAAAVNLPVGVYFFSRAITDTEAEEEATFVLEQIRGYNIDYPIAYNWQYRLKEDGSLDESARNTGCNGDQVTGFIDAFCKKVKTAGFTAAYYCDKSMGYTKLDLNRLSGYEMWYSEYRAVPSFYYDFGIWQYTKEGTVPGISEQVPINLALKKYD